MNGSITDVPGILVGQAQDQSALTGCTVVICEKGATAGVDQRGGAPGTRETDALRPMHWITQVHAVLLSGGSAYGLDAASGVMRFLEEKGIGVDTGYARVPIVAGAVLYDLGIGSADVRPDAEMGYLACLNSNSQPPSQGNYGAGSGATLGKILGMKYCMKSGIGTSSIFLKNGLIVGAIFAVNPLGDVKDPSNGQIIAGVRNINNLSSNGHAIFADTMEVLSSIDCKHKSEMESANNTVIGVVATNAKLTKEEANKVAQMAHNGLARVISPAHTMMDGDTVFTMATNEIESDINVVGAFAAKVTEDAIINSVIHASDVLDYPSASSIKII